MHASIIFKSQNQAFRFLTNNEKCQIYPKRQTRFWSGQKSWLEIQALKGWPLNITIQIRVLEINLLGFGIT